MLVSLECSDIRRRNRQPSLLQEERTRRSLRFPYGGSLSLDLPVGYSVRRPKKGEEVTSEEELEDRTGVSDWERETIITYAARNRPPAMHRAALVAGSAGPMIWDIGEATLLFQAPNADVLALLEVALASIGERLGSAQALSAVVGTGLGRMDPTVITARIVKPGSDAHGGTRVHVRAVSRAQVISRHKPKEAIERLANAFREADSVLMEDNDYRRTRSGKGDSYANASIGIATLGVLLLVAFAIVHFGYHGSLATAESWMVRAIVALAIVTLSVRALSRRKHDV